MFEFKIYDIQEIQSFNSECELVIQPFGDAWLKYDMSISVKDLWVVSTRGYDLITKTGNSYDITPCTKVTLSDGSFVYAANSKPTFDKNYSEYLTNFNKSE